MSHVIETLKLENVQARPMSNQVAKLEQQLVSQQSGHVAQVMQLKQQLTSQRSDHAARVHQLEQQLTSQQSERAQLEQLLQAVIQRASSDHEPRPKRIKATSQAGCKQNISRWANQLRQNSILADMSEAQYNATVAAMIQRLYKEAPVS